MLCEHSNWQKQDPFFACNIYQHLRIKCEQGLMGADSATKNRSDIHLPVIEVDGVVDVASV